MSEEAAIYRLDVAEQRARADGLEELYRKLSVEANELRLRIRELEDAILMHRQHLLNDACEHDDRLWGQVDRLWT